MHRISTAAVDDLQVALHGPTAACHELHTGEPGSFAAALRRLEQARRTGRRAWVWSWLTRSSSRSLVHLPDRLVGLGVQGWAVVWPRGAQLAPHGASRIVPRLGIAVPHALRAVDRARRRSLAVRLVGVPLCVLGPFGAHGRSASPAAGGPAVCQGCPSREACPGVDPWYQERHGVQELRPRPGAAAVEEATDGLQAWVDRASFTPPPVTEPLS